MERDMNPTISLRFESRLHAPREAVWQWITSVHGISAELRPYLRMSAPRGVRSLTDLAFEPGRRLFRSRVYLFGLLPIDRSDLTLLELAPRRGFLEQSPVWSMRLWRHERRLLDCPGDPGAVVLTDQLSFTPRWTPRLVGWFLRRVFEHRHAVLRTRFGTA
jgi:ligand-binding SRPBCC domain-containing protein